MADTKTGVCCEGNGQEPPNMIETRKHLESANLCEHPKRSGLGYNDGSVLVFNPRTTSTPAKRKGSKEEHQCESCGKLYRSRQGLAGHLVHLHGKEAPYKCGTCEKAFLSKTLFRSHVLGHSELKQYKCEQCGKQFTHMKDLRGHIHAVHNQDRHSCPNCDKTFAYARDISRHCRTMHQGKRYSCGVCKLSYAYRSSLKRHEKEHLSAQ